MTYEFEYDGIRVLCDKRIPKEEAIEYVGEEKGRNNRVALVQLEMTLDKNGLVDIKSSLKDSITRYRRITGYVTPDIKFNDAKRAELKSRVGHFE